MEGEGPRTPAAACLGRRVVWQSTRVAGADRHVLPLVPRPAEDATVLLGQRRVDPLPPIEPARAEAIHLLAGANGPIRCSPRSSRPIPGGARGGAEAALA